MMRRSIDRLLCIFPFEPDFFERHGVTASYIGHPLTRLIRPNGAPGELRRQFGVAPDMPLVALLPGSRTGEVLRHLPDLIEAAELIVRERPARFILALPQGFAGCAEMATFRERFSRASIQVQEGRTWDVLACADLALAASGTVTIEACLLKTPMIAFYRVNSLSWLIGKLLVRVPFYSMVNLIAGRAIVPELMQGDLSGKRLAQEALRLLGDSEALRLMRSELADVADQLAGSQDPMEVAAAYAGHFLKEEFVHVS
jgi:lipid-A-disaccharide synthase